MSKFTVHTGALRTMADSCTAAARAVESVCADLPPAARTLADRLESDTAALRRLVRLAMGLTGGFSLLVGAALVLFGKDAAILLYHDAQAGRYVQVLGFVAPFMYLESMVDAILKGMGEQLATFRYSVLDSILRIAGILWLMPQYGMPGFLAVMTASNLLTCGLNTGRMVRQLRREKVGTEREIRN